MAHLKNISFGVPSIPRQSFPSMYEILSWHDPKNANNQKIEEVPLEPKVHIQETKKQDLVQNISQVKSQYSECKGKKISKSCTKHYQLYEYKKPHHTKAQSQSHYDTSKSKVVQSNRAAKQIPTKLDPKVQEECKEIEQRRRRIKTFELVTRDLPNTAFTTYYGKPAFEAYGRGNSNPSLLSHNVMPHKGDNHPKSIQSYYSALIKGKKMTSSVCHIPRKPIQQISSAAPITKKQSIINLPLPKPDLINNVRFTAHNPRQKKDEHIPTSKISKLKQKIAKSVKKPKKERQVKQKIIADDGLKYMNNRQNLLKIIEDKRVNASKLAYKVTDCYPCEWQNEQKYKEQTRAWQNEKMAGLPSKKGDHVGDLMKFNTQKHI